MDEKSCDPTLYAFTPDCTLKSGECNCTQFKPGTTLQIGNFPTKNVLKVTVKEQLKGLKGNHVTMGYKDAGMLGLDTDIVWSNGYPTDVVHVIRI